MQQQAMVAPPAPIQQPVGHARGYVDTPYPLMPNTAPQAQYLFANPGQRMGLAIASLALLIPLIAIATGAITNLMPYMAAGVAITLGLVAAAFVCLTVIAVNVVFNFDLIRGRR